MKKLKKQLKKWKKSFSSLKRKVLSKSKKILAWKPSFKLSNNIWKTKQIFKTFVVLPVLFCLSVSIISRSVEQIQADYLYTTIGDSVVKMKAAPGAEQQGLGTGFHIIAPSGKTYIMTNHHICEMQKDGIILVQDKLHSDRFIGRRVIEMFEKNDLCIVEALEGYKGLEVAEESPRINKIVYGVGFPLGQELGVSQGKVKGYSPITIMQGPITEENKCDGAREHKETINIFFFSIDVCVKDFDAINTDTPIFPGNSGSPMVDMWGKVQGVFFAANQRSNWGSAVPLSDVKELLKAY